MTGIAAVGAYAPRFRISAEGFEEAWGRFQASGIDEKALPNADEDALTMGREAAVRTLDAAGGDGTGLDGTDVDGTGVDVLAFATTNPPVEEGDLTARLGAMLGVPDDATRLTFGASTRAGTRALTAVLDEAPERGLVVAADCPEGVPDDQRDHAAGAGAAALLVTPDGAAEVVDRAEHAEPYPGTRFRRRGSETVESVDVTEYDRAAFREPIRAAVGGLDADPGDLDAAAIQAPDGGLPYRAVGAIGVDSAAVQACETVSVLGDAGAASVPLSLSRALADGHERVLAVGWGGGAGADALLVERDGTVAADLAIEAGEAGEQVGYADYLRRRGAITSGPPEGGGAYVSLPSWKRTIPQRYRLVAGRCPECGTLVFPPEGACRECGHLGEYEDVELPGTGTVEAVTGTSQGAAPPEFAEQQSRSGDFGVAIVAFDGPESADSGARRSERSGGGPGGNTVSAPAQVVDGHHLSVGDRVDATVRRIYTQEGVTRYGFKVEPAA